MYFAVTIYNVGYRRGNQPRPVPFVLGAHGADEFGVRVGQQAQWIRIELDMRAVFLAVARNALEQFFPFLGGLDADADNLHAGRNVSLGFVDEGRHLGPAPGSPTAAVEKNHGGGRLGKQGGEFNGSAVDVLQLRGWKLIADF